MPCSPSTVRQNLVAFNHVTRSNLARSQGGGGEGRTSQTNKTNGGGANPLRTRFAPEATRGKRTHVT